MGSYEAMLSRSTLFSSLNENKIYDYNGMLQVYRIKIGDENIQHDKD